MGDWIQFEVEFPKYFEFIESLKRRTSNCENRDYALNLIWIHRWLNGEVEIDKMYIPYYDEWFAWIGMFGGHIGIKTTLYHHWIWGPLGTRYLSFLKYNLNRILREKPLTFNINDDYPETEYHEHRRQFRIAMEQYFPVKSPLE